MSSIGVPSWFEEFITETALPAPDNAVVQLSRLRWPFGMFMNLPPGILFG